MTTTTTQEKQRVLAVFTAARIKNYLAKNWIDDGQEAEAVAEISAKVSSAIMDWLLALHGPTQIVTTAKRAAEKAIKTHCYEEETEAIQDMYGEAIAAINNLHNSAAAAEKAAKQAEKEAAAAKKAADKERKAAEKAAKTAADKAAKELRRLAALKAKNALQNFVANENDEINLFDVVPGDFVSFISPEGYTDTYPVYDLSSNNLYLVEGYNSEFKPDTINCDLEQFQIRPEGIVFIDAFDATNAAGVKCYRRKPL